MLVRFDVDRELDELRREVNRAFSGFPPMPGIGDRWMPAMDTVEQDGSIRILLDLPGMTDDDIDVEVEGDRLTIRGERQIERERGDERWHRYERASGSFERTLQLPHPIDADQVTATFDHGVLSVVVPTPEPAPPASRHVPISRGNG